MIFSKFFLAGALAFVASAAYCQPTITDVGVLGGGTTSGAHAVNSDGSVVVGASDSANGTRAFRWTQAGGMQDLGILDGGTSSGASGVSDNGAVVIGSSFNPNGNRAFRWTAASGMQSLGTLPGGSLTYGWGMNGDGSVVVGYSYGPGRGFRWTAAGGMQNLGTFPGGIYSEAWSASSDGSVVAGYSTVVWPGHAARWTQGGGWQDLGTLAPGDVSIAYGISGNGQVVVGENWVPMQYPGHAFRWTPGTGMQDLGTLPGGSDSVAYGTNWGGSIVVGRSQGWAMLWSPSTGMVDLNDWLPKQDVDLTGWLLTTARAISPDGSAIVGSGVHNGIARGWLVTGLPGSTTVSPASYSLFRGTVFSGNINSLLYSDNNRLVMRPGVVLSSQEAPVQLVVNGTSPTPTPTRLELSVEGNCSAANITQSLALWNYDSQSYETLGSSPVTTSDSSILVVAIEDAERFIGPNNALRAKVNFRAHGPIIVYPWQARVDRVKWRVMD